MLVKIAPDLDDEVQPLGYWDYMQARVYEDPDQPEVQGPAIAGAQPPAAALAALLDDPAAARGLGARAREWVLGHRTWAANARRYDALYRRLGVTAPSA